MKRISAATVLATEWCCDVSNVTENRYQAGRTNIPVFTGGDDYYCVTRIGGKPATHCDADRWNWVTMNSSFAESVNKQIWISVNIKEQ